MCTYISLLECFKTLNWVEQWFFGEETENKIEVSIFVEIETSSNRHQVLETFNTVLIMF